jgi:hypothetical protein
MDMITYAPLLRTGFASAIFLLGLGATLAGLRTMLAQDYQQSLRRLSVQSAQIGQKAIGDMTVAPVLEAAAQLITAVNQLVRTAVGVGAFLSLGGVLLMMLGYSLVPR